MLIKWVLWHVQSVLISDLNQLEVIISCSCLQRYVSHQAPILLVIILQLCHVTCLSQLITDAIVPITSLLCTDCVKSSRSLPKHSSHLKYAQYNATHELMPNHPKDLLMEPNHIFPRHSQWVPSKPSIRLLQDQPSSLL